MFVRVLERCCLLGGLLALGVFVTSYAVPRVQATETIASFKQHAQQLQGKRLSIAAPDMVGWSPERVAAYEAALGDQTRAVGILKIERVAIEAPVFNGASDEVLDRGIGWIEGTAKLNQPGNVGLAAHRDGFFRGLKDIQIGDEVRTETLSGERVYRVTGTEVIEPGDTYVLAPTSRATLTLVTCYPFYFVGSAPNRFVVFATEV